MNLIDRVKNILITPKTEWLVIDTETTTPQNMLMSYVFPLAILSALGTFISSLLSRYSGYSGFGFVWVAVIGFIAVVVGFYISTYVIDMLAPSFDSEKNLGKSAQLVAYSNTPVWIAGFISGILSVVPFLGTFIGVILAIAAWVYSVYIFYNGLGILKKTPEAKKIVYMVVAYIVMIVIGFIISAILGALFVSVIGVGAMGRGLGF